MDSLTFVRDLGDDVRRPTAAELVAARARLMVEIERESAAVPVAIGSRSGRHTARDLRRGDALAPVTPLERQTSRGRRIGAIALAAAVTVGVAAAAIGGVTLLRELAPDDRVAGPTPTPTADPTTAPPVLPDPSDRAAWIITEDGTGPFTVGMPWSDAVAAGAGFGWDMSAAQGENCVPWFGSPAGEGPALNVYGSEGTVFAITVSPYVDDAGRLDPAGADLGPRTEGGVGPYDTIDDVRAAHPQVVDSEVTQGSSAYATLDADGAGSMIHFGYRAGAPDQVFAVGDLETIQINAFGQPIIELEGCMRGAGEGGEGEGSGGDTGSGVTLTPDGIGEFAVGAPLTEAARAGLVIDRSCAESFWAPSGEHPANEGWPYASAVDAPPAFGMRTSDGEAGGEIELIEVLAPTLQTAEGIGLGSTIDDLRAAYPAAEEILAADPDGGEPLGYAGYSVAGAQGHMMFTVVTDAAWDPQRVGQVVSILIAPDDGTVTGPVWGEPIIGCVLG
ncbi:hypothetical protein ACH0AH_05420 [Microbacterium paludicola]|uniref:hypothetical protein n=1 Tax=Microbacterium paludicola TaxID=300019 RepID=UPI003879F5D4